jgi:hypothetical protein
MPGGDVGEERGDRAPLERRIRPALSQRRNRRLSPGQSNLQCFEGPLMRRKNSSRITAAFAECGDDGHSLLSLDTAAKPTGSASTDERGRESPRSNVSSVLRSVPPGPETPWYQAMTASPLLMRCSAQRGSVRTRMCGSSNAATVSQSPHLAAALPYCSASTFCSEIRRHLPANCAFSSVVGDGGCVVMTSPATPPTPVRRRAVRRLREPRRCRDMS